MVADKMSQSTNLTCTTDPSCSSIISPSATFNHTHARMPCIRDYVLTSLSTIVLDYGYGEEVGDTMDALRLGYNEGKAIGEHLSDLLAHDEVLPQFVAHLELLFGPSLLSPSSSSRNDVHNEELGYDGVQGILYTCERIRRMQHNSLAMVQFVADTIRDAQRRLQEILLRMACIVDQVSGQEWTPGEEEGPSTNAAIHTTRRQEEGAARLEAAFPASLEGGGSSIQAAEVEEVTDLAPFCEASHWRHFKQMFDRSDICSALYGAFADEAARFTQKMDTYLEEWRQGHAGAHSARRRRAWERAVGTADRATAVYDLYYRGGSDEQWDWRWRYQRPPLPPPPPPPPLCPGLRQCMLDLLVLELATDVAFHRFHEALEAWKS